MTQPKTQTSDGYTSLMFQSGAALALAGGIVFWAHSKISGLSEKIEALNKHINQLEEVLKTQGQYIAQHDNALQQIIVARHPPPPQKSRPRYNNSNNNSNNSNNRSNPQPNKRGNPPPKQRGGQSPLRGTHIEADEEELTQSQQEELDNNLGEELGELYEGYEECNEDGSCSVTYAGEKKKLKGTI